MSDTLTCSRCGTSFELAPAVKAKYPGWEPDLCRSCYGGSAAGTTTAGRSTRGGRKRSGPIEENLSLADVLLTYDAGPDTGVFTDGSADPNPGPGGWGAVYVVEGQVQAQEHGHDPDTTNNRMELTAIVHGMDLVPEGTEATIYTDSKLAVNTLTQWAAGWKARGWKRKTGPVENLDLVEVAYEKLQDRPELSIEWIAAHSGYRWNEYADSLSTAYRRDEL